VHVPAAAPAAAARPAPGAEPRRKSPSDDGFSDAIMAWMKQGDRLSEAARAAEAVDPLAGLDIAEAPSDPQRAAAKRARVRARRVRQSLIGVAAVAGAWAAIAWSARPHIIQAGDRSAYAAPTSSAGRTEAPAAASVRAVRLDAPGAWLAPQAAAPQKSAASTAAGTTPGTTPAAPAAGQTGVLAVEVPTTAASSAAAHARHRPAPAKHRGRAHR